MNKNLLDDSVVSSEKMLCLLVSKICKKNKVPKIIEKLSKKRYKASDDLKRYYIKNTFGVEIGRYSYGYEYIGLQHLKKVGDFCSIAIGATGVHGNHHMEFVTTSPILTSSEFGFSDDYDEESYFNSIEIGNDVWIGADSLIFPFVKIGDGAVIAAGSIIRKDVPPYAVVGGVDRIIKYRFSDEIIQKLLKIKWWNWDDNKIKENIVLMQDIEKFLRKFEQEV